MFSKVTGALEPFAFTIIILSGASLTGWVEFSNHYIVGIVTVFCGMLLVVNHIATQVKKPKKG